MYMNRNEWVVWLKKKQRIPLLKNTQITAKSVLRKSEGRLEGNARFAIAYKEKELPETPGGWGQSGVTLEGMMWMEGCKMFCLQVVGQWWIRDWSCESAVPEEDLDGRDPILYLGKTKSYHCGAKQILNRSPGQQVSFLSWPVPSQYFQARRRSSPKKRCSCWSCSTENTTWIGTSLAPYLPETGLLLFKLYMWIAAK